MCTRFSQQPFLNLDLKPMMNSHTDADPIKLVLATDAWKQTLIGCNELHDYRPKKAILCLFHQQRWLRSMTTSAVVKKNNFPLLPTEYVPVFKHFTDTWILVFLHRLLLIFHRHEKYPTVLQLSCLSIFSYISRLLVHVCRHATIQLQRRP